MMIYPYGIKSEKLNRAVVRLKVTVGIIFYGIKFNVR